MTHLPLLHLKAFALRWHSAEVADVFDPKIENCASWKRVRYLVEEANEGEQLKKNTLRLDNFLQEVLSHDDVYPPPAIDPAAQWRRSLYARREIIDCTLCAVKAGAKPCYGHSANDERAVDGAGACIQPIKEAFADGMKMAEHFYRDACLLGQVGASLSTVYDKVMHFAGLEPSVGGQVIWHDTPGLHWAELQVIVETGKFDRYGLKLLRYVVMHEAFCHVFQQVAGGPRDGGLDYDAFAEGWLDYIAAELVAGTNGAGATAGLAGGPFNDPEVVKFAQDFHEARVSAVRKPRFNYRHKVQLGVDAALAVLRLFKAQSKLEGADNQYRFDQTQPDPWLDFVHLSCQLNTAPWDALERTAVLSELPRRLGSRPGELDRTLVDALIDWRRRERPAGPEAVAPVITALQKIG